VAGLPSAHARVGALDPFSGQIPASDFVVLADEPVEPELLDRLVEALDADPDAGLAYAGDVDFGQVAARGPFGAVALLRRDAVEDAGWQPLLELAEWDLWLGIAAGGRSAVQVDAAPRESGIPERLIETGDGPAKAKLVVRRPWLFSEAQVEWAAGVLAGDPTWLAAPHSLGAIPPQPRFAGPPPGGGPRIDSRRLFALAYAADVIARPELLRAWTDAFGADDDVTLVIAAGDGDLEPLGAAVDALGLEEGRSPDLLATPVPQTHSGWIRARADLLYADPADTARMRAALDQPVPEPPPPTRVLAYNPYNFWALHGQWEMTILQSLKLRGADVTYVLCDGLYSDCDIFWDATLKRPDNACQICQTRVTQLASGMGMDWRWLGRWLLPEEPAEARRWVKSLSREELFDARYGDWDVADWVLGSVHSHLRASSLDLDDPKVERVVRSYVYSGLVASFALDRMLADQQPDVFLTFNGRQSSTRVALELARRRGIRTIVHERGPRKETLGLYENSSCADLGMYRRYWEAWGEIPLTPGEAERVHRFALEREHGINMTFAAFNVAPQATAAIAGELDLDPSHPTWVLFTSSDDEVVFEPDWQGAFPSQIDWIDSTVEYARRHPDLQLVIRVHPNVGGKRSLGQNAGQLQQMLALRERVPANVRMVMPDDEVSSYTLMELAAVGLIYNSTVGLEMACRGKAVVAAAGSHVTGLPFVHTVDSTGSYHVLLDGLRALPARAASDDVRRLAHRMAYGVWFRIPLDFPLVEMPDPATGQLAWSSLDELAPGRDAGLDRAARILLEGEPVSPAPDAAALARGEGEEIAFWSTAGTTADLDEAA
jgi:hypothetical protein